MIDAIGKPIENLMSGEGFLATIDEQLKRAHREAIEGALAAGTSRLGAYILYTAEAEDRDPSDDIKDLTKEYMRAVDLIGVAQANLAIDLYTTTEDFSAMLDGVEEAREKAAEAAEAQARKEDYLFDHQKMNARDYVNILKQRMNGLEEYSDEWISLQDQIINAEEDIADQEDRIFRNKFEAGVLNNAEYIAYLQQRLTKFEQYSDEWMDIWRELEGFEDDAEQASQDAVSNIADAIKQSFDQFRDPIIEATSLISAFGNEASMTRGQMEGFFEHQIEGTRRWVDTIKRLKDMGINPNFLQDLIAQGPRSLGFAESVLALGQEGVGFINDSMGTIDDLVNPAGLAYANATIGQAIQNQQNITLTIGQIDLSFDNDGALTLDDVNRAIDTALANLANSINNRTVGSNA